MRTSFRWLFFTAGAAVVIVVLLAVVARFSDGPIGPFPGGPLRSGELVADPDIAWSFATDVREVELQLVEPPRSRTTWIVVHNGQPYVPCGLVSFRLWKQWPHEAVEDGRAVLRIDGKRYERQAVRVEDDRLFAKLAALLEQKYPMTSRYRADPGSLWFFRLDPR